MIHIDFLLNSLILFLFLLDPPDPPDPPPVPLKKNHKVQTFMRSNIIQHSLNHSRVFYSIIHVNKRSLYHSVTASE